MYKARVEQVNGINVRAGGKWLRCIGNKNVRVGDVIWTDGRCVYGYEKESQTPIVIKVNDDLVIPIQRGKSIDYFYKNKLHNVGEFTSDYNSIVNNKNNILFSSSDRSTLNIYTFNSPILLSANCDKAGNVFELSVLQNSYIKIYKDKKVVKNITLEKNEFVIWGFIENSESWAYISYVTEYNETPSGGLNDYLWLMAENDKADNEATGGAVLPLEVYYQEVRYGCLRDYGDSDYESYTYNGKMTFYNSQGQKFDFISFNASVSRAWQEGDGKGPLRDKYFDADHIGSYSINYDGMSDIKFPMHDGFYFTMQNPILPYRDVIGFPIYIEKNIFSPKGQKIFSNYFSIQTNFLASESGGNNYLIVAFAPEIYNRETMGTLEGKTALTKQLGEWEYHPYGINFFADFDYTLNFEQSYLREINEKISHNNNSIFLIDSESNATMQEWYHIGYTLRKIYKKKLKKWFASQIRK